MYIIYKRFTVGPNINKIRLKIPFYGGKNSKKVFLSMSKIVAGSVLLNLSKLVVPASRQNQKVSKGLSRLK